MGEDGKSFKVIDRRRFDEEGNEREVSLDTETVKAAPSSQPPTSQGKESRSTQAPTNPKPQSSTPSQTPRLPTESDLGGSSDMNNKGDFVMGPASEEPNEHGGMLSFSSFLMSLATQALMQMGEVEPPGGLKLPPDFEAAKQTIEIIGMLAVKTKGNLDPEEQRLLAEVLHSVRLTFVQRVKSAMSSAGVAGAGMRRPEPK